jgi:hypothetical protein
MLIVGQAMAEANGRDRCAFQATRPTKTALDDITATFARAGRSTSEFERV